MSQPDAASKARTISHMNTDHRRDLSAILEHQLGIVAADTELADIDLSSLTVKANGQTHTVLISPPMASWSERRARLVKMTEAARSALGLANDGTQIVVKRFLAPRGFAAVVLTGVVFYFSCFATVRAGFVNPGTPAWEILEKAGFPYGARGFRWLVDAIFIPVMAIHIGESWWFDRTRLARFGVARGSGLWWAWMVCCFFEGLTAFKRFDGEVALLRVKKD